LLPLAGSNFTDVLILNRNSPPSARQDRAFQINHYANGIIQATQVGAHRSVGGDLHTQTFAAGHNRNVLHYGEIALRLDASCGYGCQQRRQRELRNS
jgi:hypothetical protein